MNIEPPNYQHWCIKLENLLTLNLGVVGPWVGVLRLQVIVGGLLPLTVHGLWSLWGAGSDGQEDTNREDQTTNDTGSDLTSLALWVNRTTWPPCTVGDVPSGLLLSLGQFNPWQLLSLSQLGDDFLLVGGWELLPTGLELGNGGLGDWVGGGKSDWGGSSQGSSDGCSEHCVICAVDTWVGVWLVTRK